MNRIFKISIPILAALLLSACNGQDKTLSEINGEVTVSASGKVTLYSIERGTLREVISSEIAANGSFSLSFRPAAEGFFVLGTNPTGAAGNHTFYFKPGDDLNVRITENSYELTGKNTPENSEMAAWHEFVGPLEYKSIYFSKNSSTYVDFFPLLEEKSAAAGNYEPKYTGNKSFNDSFSDLREYDVLHYALNFIVTPRSTQPLQDDYTAYYHNLDLPAITRDALMNYPYGMDILKDYSMFAAIANPDGLPEEQSAKLRMPVEALDVLLPRISDETVKGEVVLQKTGYIKTYEGLLDFQNRYGKYLSTDDQRDRFEAMLEGLKPKDAGKSAPDFRFEDIDGNEVSLSDFAGKVVYIDVWATWCGPCRQQIPYLKELEKEYHGQEDMVFMSVSIDKGRDKNKWADMVRKESLGGVQLFAGDRADSDIMQPYGIEGTPQFILIGKDGRIISGDAPRPSSGEIRAVLGSALKK